MDDIRIQKDLVLFLFLETKKPFFCYFLLHDLSVVFLLACVPGKSMTIV